MNKASKNERGFSLIEVLIVVVIVSILAAIAVIGFSAVQRGIRDRAQPARLQALAVIQQKYRKSNPGRRYATLEELCANNMLPLNITPGTANCGDLWMSGINGWRLTYTPETYSSVDYSKYHFGATLEIQNRQVGDTRRNLCIFEDSVVRQAPANDFTNCTRNSPPY